MRTGKAAIDSIMARASISSKGAARKVTSFRASTKRPPSPNMTIGPNTGSRCTPRIVSTPPVTIGATRHPSIAASGRAARPAATISPNAASAPARSATPSRTPPTSLLCAMSADSTLRTTGKPSAAAASPASAAVRARRAGATGTPAAATAARAPSSLTGPTGRSAAPGTAGRGRRSRNDRANPASAATARVACVASSYTGTPAASRSRV